MSSFLLKAAATVAIATIAAASAPKDGCTDDMDPTQVRLAYHGDRGMAVSWNTKVKLNTPTVYWGLDGSTDNIATSSKSVTYASSSTYSNHVVITGLEPDTRYHYTPQCGHRAFSFTTARSIGKADSFKFAMVGDLGTMGPDGLSTTTGTGAGNPLKPGDITTSDALHNAKTSFDFVFHVGDIAYADAWLKEEKGGYITPLNTTDNGAVYDRILNEFYDQLYPVTRDVPYMVAVGNHEANCDNGGDLTICVPGQLNFTGYRNHWNMPSDISGGVENFWYSFDHGMVHFVTFNTETDFPGAPDEPGGSGKENGGPFAPTGAQLAWLKKDLAAVDRKKTPWVIAAGHRPWYVSSSGCTTCQSAFESLLIEYGVDLVMAGHVHFYERHSAIANGAAQEIGANPSAPWYIVNGAAGHYDGLDTPTVPSAATARKQVVTYGWSLYTVHNCTHLTTEFIASGNGSVLDTATLYKNRTCTLEK